MVSVGNAVGVTLTGVVGTAFFLVMRRPALLRRASEAQFRYYRPAFGKKDLEAFCRLNSRLLLGFAMLTALLGFAGVIQLIGVLFK